MAFGRVDRVRQEHGDGEGSDSSGYGRVGGSNFGGRGGIDIANEPAFAGMKTIHTDVDYGSSRFDEIGGDERWTTDGGYQNIGAAGLFGQVRRLRMTDGDGGVGVKQEQRHRFAHDVATSNDDGVFAGHGDLITAQQFHDAGGRAGARGGNVRDQVSDI